MSEFYSKHLFFCVNQKNNGKKCCMAAGAEAMWLYAKTRLAAVLPPGDKSIRVNKSGCLGRCASGPVLVVYPEGTWYTYYSQADIDRIIDEHILGGQVVESLRIQKDS